VNQVTAIVIPTFKRQHSLFRCLDSFYNDLPSDHIVYLVDADWSKDTESLVASRYPDVRLLPGHPDLWWTGTINIGINQALEDGADRIITLNDDCVLPPTLLTQLNKSAGASPDAMISAVCCYLAQPDLVFFAGRMRSNRTDRFFYLDLDQPVDSIKGGLRKVDLLHGMCTLFPAAVFRKVGLFDADAFPHLYADDDLVLQATRGGFQSIVDLDAIVFNDRSQTGLNPYDRRLGAVGIWRLLTSRRSTFQITSKTRFLWRHRRSTLFFLKTLVSDYVRLFSVIMGRWLLTKEQLARLNDRNRARHLQQTTNKK
jgi:GT2 family glycosyltransferase